MSQQDDLSHLIPQLPDRIQAEPSTQEEVPSVSEDDAVDDASENQPDNPPPANQILLSNKVRVRNRTIRQVDLLYRPEDLTSRMIDRISAWWTIADHSVGRILAACNRIRVQEGKSLLIYADIYAALHSLMQQQVVQDRKSGFRHKSNVIELNLKEFQFFYRTWKAGGEREECYRMATTPSQPVVHKDGKVIPVQLDEHGFPPPLKYPMATDSYYKKMFHQLSKRWSDQKNKVIRPKTARERVQTAILRYAQYELIQGSHCLVINMRDIPPEIIQMAMAMPDFRPLFREQALEALGIRSLATNLANATHLPAPEELGETVEEIAERIGAVEDPDMVYGEEEEEGSDAVDDMDFGVPDEEIQANLSKIKSPLDDDELNDEGFEEPSFENLSPAQIDAAMMKKQE